MKNLYTYRRGLLAPLVYLAALLLLLEEWLWSGGARLLAWVGRFPPLHALESRIRALPPYAALAIFVLPTVLLLPVKVLALLAITHGHALSGICVILCAKLGGAAAVARLYTLTLPALLTLAWFAYWHGRFLALSARWIGQLRATSGWRRVSGLAALLRAAWRTRRRARKSGRTRSRPARVLRRFCALWRARRR